IVDGIVRQLQRLSALTPRKGASADMEEVGWSIELALRRAGRGLAAPEQLQVETTAAEVSVVEEAARMDDEAAETEVEPVAPAVVAQPNDQVFDVAADDVTISETIEETPLLEMVEETLELETVGETTVTKDEEDVPAAAAAIGDGAPAPIRVLLVDDEPRTLAMLAVSLKGEHDIEVIGLASDVSEAIGIARTSQPDVAVVDVRMPRGGGPRAARGILALSSSTRILAYSALDERRAVLSMLEAGAVGYLVKGGPQEEVAGAIRKAMRGERPLSGRVAGEVMEALTERVRLEADDRDSSDQAERQVRRFLSGRDLRMVWQPIVRLHTGDVVGAEALPRFRNAGKRTPEGWFREAWRLGFGAELEITVLEGAAARLERLPEELFIAVNLSPGCLVEPGFLGAVKHLPWERIVIEVTERSSVDDYGQLRAAARDLRRRGGRLAVDDAGAAFASLRHVAEIEPDLVKMDERVSRSIHMDPRMYALATALISFARELGAEIVAEGIEHRGQLDALKAIGVEYGQGPIFTGVADSKEVQVRLPKKLRGRR
ncbi:MAG TPA: EAL domain-containing protein, partial [Actinomycetota bacterium]|nr:EAL domain-containing protein [Actinomycetota bacterium]